VCDIEAPCPEMTLDKVSSTNALLLIKIMFRIKPYVMKYSITLFV